MRCGHLGTIAGWSASWWPAVFHSVSAFCNAGFSTFSDSWWGFRDSSLSLIVISALIIAGGVGFIAMEETLFYFSPRPQARLRRLSVHSHLVLVTTLLLLVPHGRCSRFLNGTILGWFIQWRQNDEFVFLQRHSANRRV